MSPFTLNRLKLATNIFTEEIGVSSLLPDSLPTQLSPLSPNGSFWSGTPHPGANSFSFLVTASQKTAPSSPDTGIFRSLTYFYSSDSRWKQDSGIEVHFLQKSQTATHLACGKPGFSVMEEVQKVAFKFLHNEIFFLITKLCSLLI